MGTITSGIGLISGIDIQSLVDQLIAIEARPRQRLLARVGNIDAQRTAFLDLSARLSAMLSRVRSLTRPSFFQASSANSSNPAALSATASEGAVPGSFQFIVRSLATTHQLVSRGFSDPTAPIEPGTLTLESGRARVNRQTELSALNGFAGVQRGRFEITDGSGATAVISIVDAVNVSDVVDKINAARIDVRAALNGDAIVLTETSNGALRVREVGGGHTAADLGFAAGHATGNGTLRGTNLMVLSNGTPLSALNDGNGIRKALAGGDFNIVGTISFDVDLGDLLTDSTRLERLNHGNGVELGRIRITTRDGQSSAIDLRGLQTIGEVKDAIEAAFDPAGAVSVISASGRLIVSDTTGGEVSPFIIEDLDGGRAARDLGIAASVEDDQIDGRDLLFVDTVGDVVNAINQAEGNDGTIVASISADGLRIFIDDTGDTALTFTAIGESQALFDLGLSDEPYTTSQVSGRRVIGGIGTTLLHSLNGGRGFETGVIRIDVGGNSANVDLNGLETLGEVIDAINGAAGNLGIEADYDTTGTRLVVRNAPGGSSSISISDVSGTFAAALGLDRTTGSEIRSDNLQRQYISENTLIEELNAGRGVSLSQFKITDSAGLFTTVDLSIGGINTLRDVIREINLITEEKGLSVTASINENGDGLLLTDTAGGPFELRVEENGGTIARDLNILGESEDGRIDGSFEFHLETSASDTLEDIMRRINEETTLASASLFNDGTAVAPYRLSISSRALGLNGELVIDGSGIGVDFTTLTRAQDASIILGDSAENGVLITSSSNSISGVVEGLTLNLNEVDENPVTVTIERDLDALVAAMSGLVNDFNGLADRIADLSRYDPDTETAGLLLGDGTLRLIESRLFRMFTGVVPGATGSFNRLSQAGIRLSEGARLSFDEQKFRDAYEANPEQVTDFFTAEGTGVAHRLQEQIEFLTEAGGLLDRRGDALASQKDILSDRADELTVLLNRKRERLTRQFLAMETALAGLQAQQSALISLASLAASATR